MIKEFFLRKFQFYRNSIASYILEIKAERIQEKTLRAQTSLILQLKLILREFTEVPLINNVKLAILRLMAKSRPKISFLYYFSRQTTRQHVSNSHPFPK